MTEYELIDAAAIGEQQAMMLPPWPKKTTIGHFYLSPLACSRWLLGSIVRFCAYGIFARVVNGLPECSL